eukprot:c38278_g1_i1 orf=253-465(+)
MKSSSGVPGDCLLSIFILQHGLVEIIMFPLFRIDASPATCKLEVSYFALLRFTLLLNCPSKLVSVIVQMA